MKFYVLDGTPKEALTSTALLRAFISYPTSFNITTPSSRTACLSTRPTGNAPQQISPDSLECLSIAPNAAGRWAERAGRRGHQSPLRIGAPGSPGRSRVCGVPGPPEVGGGGPGGGRRRLARRPGPTARPSAGSALRPREEEGAGATAARTRPLAFPSGRRAARGGGAAAAGSVCASRPRSSQTLGEHGGGGAGGPGAPRRRRRGRGGAVGHGPRAFLLLGLCAARSRAARRGLRAPHPEVPQPVRGPDRHAPQIRGAALRRGVGPVRGPAQGLRGERALQGAPRAAADPAHYPGKSYAFKHCVFLLRYARKVQTSHQVFWRYY
ncbi:isochorismatase domain-containing protein 1 isoform X1 [Bos javanicus]|uniref:isochorismatase domain-containing protein 1 isoform X1 n=1 Tax=Bos javanicus TaxID=9906 RepID=UPI002AA614CE|nr:isochorismatase domain-containing protein 1 isoform X1 [Bos javanicus]